MSKEAKEFRIKHGKADAKNLESGTSFYQGKQVDELLQAYANETIDVAIQLVEYEKSLPPEGNDDHEEGYQAAMADAIHVIKTLKKLEK